MKNIVEHGRWTEEEWKALPNGAVIGYTATVTDSECAVCGERKILKGIIPALIFTHDHTHKEDK